MKGNLKRISTFLGYTIAYNFISFIFFFILSQFHNFFGPIVLIFVITQICFTILFFNKIPLPKTSNEKGFKTDLALYFIILCILSVAIAISEKANGSWFNYMFVNTYYTFAMSFSFLDTLGVFIGVYIIENVIKTFLLYTNISKKTLPKPVCIILSVIMVLAFIVLLAIIS